MLEILLSEDPGKFQKLEKILRDSIRICVGSFSRDSMLKRFQNSEDLYNVALLKLDLAIKNFEYNPKYPDKHNENRFLAMLRRYIVNALIDETYKANLPKRKPKLPIVALYAKCEQDCDEFINEPSDTTNDPHDHACAKEMIKIIGRGLNEKEMQILSLLSKGYPVVKIAGKLGVNVSSVRFTVYSKIQPKADEYALNSGLRSSKNGKRSSY